MCAILIIEIRVHTILDLGVWGEWVLICLCVFFVGLECLPYPFLLVIIKKKQKKNHVFKFTGVSGYQSCHVSIRTISIQYLKVQWVFLYFTKFTTDMWTFGQVCSYFMPLTLFKKNMSNSLIIYKCAINGRLCTSLHSFSFFLLQLFVWQWVHSFVSILTYFQRAHNLLI